MSGRIISDGFSTASTTDTFGVGTRAAFNHSSYGEIEAMWVLNGEASTAFAQGDLIRRKAATIAPATGTISATAKLSRQIVLGVADHAIPAGSYGWIITKGRCQMKGDGSVTAGSTVISDATAGRSKNATLTNADEAAAAFGLALEDDGAAGSLFDGVVNL